MQDAVNQNPAEDTEIRPFLLVEDNPINQKVALRILSHFGYQADAVDNGQEALQALERKPYDIVLMDIQMPVLDGIAATRMIRQRYGPLAPYIIAVTANVTEEDRRNCMEAGMNDFVCKPIKPAVLQDAISKAGIRTYPKPTVKSATE